MTIIVDTGVLVALLEKDTAEHSWARERAHHDCRVFTLDTDFQVYRRHRNKPIPLLMPDR